MVRSEPRRRNPLWSFLALLLLTAFAAGIFVLSTRYLQVGEVLVPDVVGRNADDAARALRQLGFEVSSYLDPTPGATPERVTSQTPGAGAVVRRGRGVALGVGRAGGGDVPQLVGLTLPETEVVLQPAGLEVAALRYRHAPEPAGTVLAQRPPAGQSTTAPTVTLTVSSGPRARRVQLPRVVGKPLEVARRQLTALGFRRVEAVPTRLGAPGVTPGVTAQNPRPGRPINVSAPVTLYYTVANRQVVPIPSVVGLNLSQAAARLQAAGLRVGTVTEDAFDPARPRGVSAVQPAEYTLWGTAVALRTNGNAGSYVAGNPVLPPPVPTSSRPPVGSLPGTTPGTLGTGVVAVPTPDPTLGLPATGGRVIPIDYDPANYSFLQGRAYDFRVEVTDDEGTRKALRQAMGPDEVVDAEVTVYGEAELRMYIDGQIVLAYNPPNP